jgi:hypothetical protein
MLQFPQPITNTFESCKSKNLKNNDNKMVDEQTHSIPELLRNSPYTAGVRCLLLIFSFRPCFLGIPILLKSGISLKLHHPLDSENELRNQTEDLIEWEKSNNQYAFYRRELEWQPEDYFRPAYCAQYLEVDLDGTTRVSKAHGSWSNNYYRRGGSCLKIPEYTATKRCACLRR